MKLSLCIFFISFSILSCESDKSNVTGDNIVSPGINQLFVSKKPLWFSLKLKYSHTEKIENQPILFFDLTIKNNSEYTLRYLKHGCPYYDHLEVDGNYFLEFYPKYHCYSNPIGYEVFKPLEIKEMELQFTLSDSTVLLEGMKFRVKLIASFGISSIAPSEMGARLESPPAEYFSNHVSLKNDYKQVNELVK